MQKFALDPSRDNPNNPCMIGNSLVTDKKINLLEVLQHHSVANDPPNTRILYQVEGIIKLEHLIFKMRYIHGDTVVGEDLLLLETNNVIYMADPGKGPNIYTVNTLFMTSIGGEMRKPDRTTHELFTNLLRGLYLTIAISIDSVIDLNSGTVETRAKLDPSSKIPPNLKIDIVGFFLELYYTRNTTTEDNPDKTLETLIFLGSRNRLVKDCLALYANTDFSPKIINACMLRAMNALVSENETLRETIEILRGKLN